MRAACYTCAVPPHSPRALVVKAAAATRQLLSRQQQDLVLFHSFSGRFSDNPLAIYEELVRRGGGQRLVWTAQGRFPPEVTTVGLDTAAYPAALGSAHLLVANEAVPRYVKKPGQTYLQCWHGTPLKRIGYDNPRYGNDRQGLRRAASDYRRWDLLVSQSPFCSQALRRAFRYDGELLEVGQPRNDLLRAPDADAVRARTRGHFGVPDDVLLVLYAPTFRDDRVGDRTADLALSPAALQQVLGERVHLLVRLHHRDAAAVTEPPSPAWTPAWDYPDLRELYLAADVLVTDYSSAMFDFAVTGKPIVLFTHDLEHYRDELRGFTFDLSDVAPGPICTSSRAVAEALGGLEEVRNAYAAAYEQFRSTFCPWDDGYASQRVVDRLLREG
jgi:CDP-glycerol glycerophosphotransferase